jgi:hypothetical protein
VRSLSREGAEYRLYTTYISLTSLQRTQPSRRNAHTRKEGQVVGRSRGLRRRGRGGYQRMCQKEEAQQTAPRGANQQKTQRWTAVCRISASYKGQDHRTQANRPASESPEKQQKGLYQYTAWKGLRLSNFSLYEGFFSPRKKNI